MILLKMCRMTAIRITVTEPMQQEQEAVEPQEQEAAEPQEQEEVEPQESVQKHKGPC